MLQIVYPGIQIGLAVENNLMSEALYLLGAVILKTLKEFVPALFFQTPTACFRAPAQARSDRNAFSSAIAFADPRGFSILMVFASLNNHQTSEPLTSVIRGFHFMISIVMPC